MPDKLSVGIQEDGPFTPEQQFVDSLVQQYQHAAVIPDRKRARLPDLVKINLKAYEGWTARAYQVYQDVSTSAGNISLTAEWVLDNYYILQQAFHLIEEDMPPVYLAQLPRLVDAPYNDFPRIFALVRSLLLHQNLLLNLDDLRRSLEQFQEEAPLTMGELWSIPIFIRFALLEKLAFVLIDDIKPDARIKLPEFPPVPREGELPAEEMARGEIKDQAEIVASIVRSLRVISETNWEEPFESLSLVEKTLRQDPAGIYPNMDFKTRNQYRGEIEKLTKLTARDESDLAEQLIELSTPTDHADDSSMTGSQVPEHVGSFLIGGQRRVFEQTIGYQPGVKARIFRQIKTWNTPLYLGGISLIALGLMTIVILLAHSNFLFEATGFFQFLLMFVVTLCLIPPAFIIANHLVNIALNGFTPPSLLPKLDFKRSVPQAYKTLVVIPGMISTNSDIENLVRQIEIHYLSNPQPGLKFAVLTDFSDADEPTRPEDDELIGQATAAMADLDHKYRQECDEGEQRFFLLHRRRLLNPSQGKWMGWERKRGKLHELGLFLRGDDNTSFLPQLSNSDVRQQLGVIRYVITVDADTVLPPGSAVRMVGTIAHPLNTARFDPETGQVVSGYTILQPRVDINPRSANQTWFTRIFAGDTGLDLYSHAVSDIYQDLFGEGIYVGKGIFDVDAMMQSVESHIPENTLLSHDLLEGILGRAGLISDITLIEDYPQNYYEQVARQRRWIRGDWQLLPWLLRPARFGVNFSSISYWKIIHNLLRSLLSPALMVTILLGIAFVPNLAWLWILLPLVSFGIPLVNALVNSLKQTLQSMRQKAIWPSLWPVFMRWLFAIAFLPYEAYFALDAIAVTLYRLFISKRKLLSWTTAEHASQLFRSRTLQIEAWIKLSLSAILVVIFVIVTQLESLLKNTTTILLQMPVLPMIVLWLLSSVLVRTVNRPLPSPRSEEPFKDVAFLRLIARRTWNFFENFVGPQDHWLPPDHFQESPNQVTAHHTSPSNIGLFLTSAIAAYDLGYFDHLGLVARLETTMNTLMHMERHRGHFLNWYNTQTLEPLKPRYVSTVDSGNLAISLIIVSQTCKTITEKRVFRREIWDGYADNLTSLQEVLSSIKQRHPELQTRALLLSITIMLDRIRSIRNTPLSWYPTYTFIGSVFWPNLSRNLGEFISTMPANLELEHLVRLQEVIRGIEKNYSAIQTTIDDLAPWIPFIEEIPGVFQQARFLDQMEELKDLLTYNPRLFQAPQIIGEAQALIEQLGRDLADFTPADGSPGDLAGESAAWLNGLRKALLTAHDNTIMLQQKFKQLANQADQLINELDFAFLYNTARNVFHIGFNLETGQLDNNYYDLLASEARIASVFAISRGQVPQSHWIHLGRPITKVNGDFALLSWSATMFEYLMPVLYFQSHVNTLLHKSVMTMVKYQRAYARSKNVPWGISEAGFYQFDTNMNYQYRAFGVPALGFKRGLADDLVIAPYASFMAIKWAPSSVEENTHDLISHNAYGPYGFYESIDFTQNRMSAGKRHEVIREYMAHHQGMILMALVNYLRDDIMIRRVNQDPQIQSVELLLHEQVPMGVPLLMPGEQETRGTRRISDAPVQIDPWPEPVTSRVPRMHLLSNGSYSVLLSNRGGGFSRWKNVDLTRWRADAALDPWGTWIYIQDMQKKDKVPGYSTWSAAHQPIPGDAGDVQANFFAHMAVFKRTEKDLTTTMEITVAPDDPVEIRRVHMINHAASPRHLRLTSYGEVILNQQTADARHPAYNKLFIKSEYVPELNLLIFEHRKQNATKQPIFLGHMLVFKETRSRKNENLPVGYETDRRAFIGRERSARNPAALQSSGYLTGSTGSTLDPIFSLGREVHLRSHDTYSLAYITLTAPTRKALLKLAERYRVWTKIDDAFLESNVSSLVWLGRQKVEREELRSYLDLLSLLVYPLSQKRADAEILSRNFLNQSGLWRFGISGDYPIILLEIDDPQQINLLVEVIQAQSFLRARGYLADLVVLNTQPSMYTSELNEMMIRRIRQLEVDQWINQRSGIFIRSADQMQSEEQNLFRYVARVLLKGDRGSLAEQLRMSFNPVAELPQLFSTRSSRRNLPSPPPWESKPIGDLQFYNGFGGFTADGKEYVIHLPAGKTTPAPWANVIGYPHFGFMVTQSGSQTTWAVNSGENRLSPWSNDPVSDPSGEVLYLRDEETGDIWTPTPRPVPAQRAYRVRHGAGYSVFESESHGLQQELTVFASPEDPVKLARLKIRNSRNSNRRLTATYYLEWVLGINREDSFATLIPEYSPEYSMLRARNPYHPELGKQIAFLMSSRAPHGFTTDRMEFLGSGGSIEDPAALHRIGLSNQVAPGAESCAAMQLHIDLPAHASSEVYFVVGAAENDEHLIQLAEKYCEPSMAAATLNATHAFWDNLLTRVQVYTPDPAANLMLNRWWLYQTLSCRIWGRSGFYQSSGAFGFRDQLQDVLALLQIDPAVTRDQILNAARHQFEEGDVLHWWHPPTGRGVRTRITDNLVWLPYATSLYISTTGDAAILEEKIPFLKGPPLKPGEMDRYAEYEHTRRSYTLFEHCQRALRKGSTSGEHGLPLIGSGDWNDGFNLVGSGGKGESTWLAWFLIDTLKRFAEICEQRGLRAEADGYRAQAEAYRQALEQHAWDGDWYLRAYYDDGTPLGSHTSEECQIDAIAQSWSVISSAGDRERSARSMDMVWKRLTDTRNNLSLLFTPPFEKSDANPGYIKDYPPGVRENGGQYTHAAAWSAWAYAGLGDSERAWHLYDLLNPIYQTDNEKWAAQYRVEPYISAADIYSQGAQLRRGGWTWYTGSAGWLYRLGIERLLGLRRENQVLYVDPVIPARWDGFSLQCRHLSSTYHISVKNPKHVTAGVGRVILDGSQVDGQAIQLADDGNEHHVEIVMGD
jgi:cyclic beta-1,2-glucan synthetase